MLPARSVRLLRTALLTVAVALCAAGCKIPTGDATAAAVDSATTHDLAAVTVSTEGDQPTIDVPAPFAVDATVHRIVEKGTGAAVKVGQQVTIRYLAVNGTDGEPLLEKSWTAAPTTLILGAKGNLQGLDAGLRDLAVGSKALIAFPPEEGYGLQGSPGLGVGPTDTIVCLVEVVGAQTLLTKADGKPVAAKKGLPKVTRAKDGTPKVTLPKGDAPAALTVRPVLAGSGAKVGKGDLVVVQYIGVVWPGGRVFDSSWSRGKPAQFPIGTGETISGWDGIIGQRVGSQVLLVVPPDKAYGAEGKDKFGIKGTDTLVFVVDILGTYKQKTTKKP